MPPSMKMSSQVIRTQWGHWGKRTKGLAQGKTETGCRFGTCGGAHTRATRGRPLRLDRKVEGGAKNSLIKINRI